MSIDPCPMTHNAARCQRDELRAEIKRLRAAITRAKDALLDGQSTQWVHDLLVAELVKHKENIGK